MTWYFFRLPAEQLRCRWLRGCSSNAYIDLTVNKKPETCIYGIVTENYWKLCTSVISCCFFFCITMRIFSIITRVAETAIPMNNVENGPNSTSPPRGPTDSFGLAGPCMSYRKWSFDGKSRLQSFKVEIWGSLCRKNTWARLRDSCPGAHVIHAI